MTRSRTRAALALAALVALLACGRETVTALDLQIMPTGSVDQIELVSVLLSGAAQPLSGVVLFPEKPRPLTRNDVLTVWFPDEASGAPVIATIQGYRCGAKLPNTVMTAERTLAKGQTVTVPVVISAPEVGICPGGDGGAGTTGSGGAAAGVGGAGGTTGAGGIGGASGIGGGAGGAAGGAIGGGGASGGGGGRGGTGAASGTTGAAGAVGSAGRGGTTGAAGTMGAAGAGGRGGTTGNAGTTGAGGLGGRGGSGGTTGAAGTIGAAGRGGTTGAAGTNATGGRGGAGGTSACAPQIARQVRVGITMTPAGGAFISSCGYPSALANAHVATKTGAIVHYGLVNGIDYANAATCGRCIELTRTVNGQPARMVTFTIVGTCQPNENCGTGAAQNQYVLGSETWFQIANAAEITAPSNDVTMADMIVARDVPCNFPAAENIYAQMSFLNGTTNGVRFTGQRYGLGSVRIPTIGIDLVRSSDNVWQAPLGMQFGAGPWVFGITDINGRTVNTSSIVGNNMEQNTTVNNPTCP